MTTIKKEPFIHIPEAEYQEVREKAIKFDLLQKEALRHPEQLSNYERALLGITGEGK